MTFLTTAQRAFLTVLLIGLRCAWVNAWNAYAVCRGPGRNRYGHALIGASIVAAGFAVAWVRGLL